MSRRCQRVALIGISVGLLFALALGWRHFRPARLSETDLWLRQPHDYVLLPDADYQVLSSFLEGQGEIRIGSTKGSSVLAPVTAVFSQPISVEDQQWMKRELKGLQDDTITAFHGCMRQSAVVSPHFFVKEPYQIGTFEEVSNIEKLYAHYPQTIGYVQFSCVAYSENRLQALFWVERRMTDSGVGKFVLMKKNARGDWVVAGEMVRWIA